MVCFLSQKPYFTDSTRSVLTVVSAMSIMSVGFVLIIYHTSVRMYSVLSVVSAMSAVSESMVSV